MLVQCNIFRTYGAIDLLLEHLSQSGLTFKLSKCHFAKDSIDFLGYSLSANGVQPQIDHLRAVKEFPVPVNKKKLKRSLECVVSIDKSLGIFQLFVIH